MTHLQDQVKALKISAIKGEDEDLVEKAPKLLLGGLPKEEAENIVKKLKEIGAECTME